MVREGYKMTELGEIPEEWGVIPFKESTEDIIDFRGRTPKKLGMEWGHGAIPALSANNVKMNYIDFEEECNLGSDELYEKWMTKGDLKKGDVIFTMEAPLGNVAQVPDDQKYILSQRVIALKTVPKINNTYMKYYLMSSIFQMILNNNATGTTAKGISQKNLTPLPIVIPKIEEQQKIANILSTVDEKLGQTVQLIKKIKELKKGLMQKLLTKGIGHTEFKQTEFGEIPVEWEVIKLEECCENITYGFTNPMPETYEGPFMVTAKDINNGIIQYESSRKTDINKFNELTAKSKPNIGDLLITKDGTLGRLAIVDQENICINQSVATIKAPSNYINVRFLYYLLASPKVQQRILMDAGGSTIKHIYITKIAKMNIPVPKDTVEQQKIADILSAVDDQLEEYNTKKEKLELLKKGLMQQLLTGKIRVSV